MILLFWFAFAAWGAFLVWWGCGFPTPNRRRADRRWRR